MALQIGEALHAFFKHARWEPKMNEMRLQANWETIMGKTIAKYTRELRLRKDTLIISTDVAPLKQELQLGRDRIMEHVNEFFKAPVVREVIIR